MRARKPNPLRNHARKQNASRHAITRNSWTKKKKKTRSHKLQRDTTSAAHTSEESSSWLPRIIYKKVVSHYIWESTVFRQRKQPEIQNVEGLLPWVVDISPNT